MEPCIERSIAERASQQLGHITRTQIIQLGVDHRAVRRWQERSGAVLLGERTYRLAGVAPSWRGSVMAACLDTGGSAAHRTANRLHGVQTYARDPTVEVLVLEGRRMGSSPLATVHRTTSLPPEDLLAVGPIPVVSLARAMLGVAALTDDVDDDRLRDGIDVAIRDGLASERWLWSHLERRRCRGRNGVTRLEDALQARSDTPTESWLEREFLRCLEQAGVPAPIVQRRIGAAGAFVARVDFCYPEERLVIEVKGHRHHSTRRQLEADAARENALLLAGYRVLQFTYERIVGDPAGVARDVALAVLAHRV